MRRLIRASVAAARSGAWSSQATRSVDRLVQARDVAVEALRSRRDPAVVAERRRVAARRRLVAWSLIALVVAAFGAPMLADVVGGGAGPGSIGGLVLMTGLLVYAVVGVSAAAIDLRRRTAVVRALPAPQPARRPVAVVVRPTMQRLDGYSDALRFAVGTVNEVNGPAVASIRALRDDTLAAADTAEIRLRNKAAELTALLRAGGNQMDPVCSKLEKDIAAGVDEYGRLVTAASDAASASQDLAISTAGGNGLAELTERFTALAAGMRDLTNDGH